MDLSEHAINFISNLTLVGDFAGEPAKLRHWQIQILRTLFATTNGKRDVAKFFLLLPRKNGKTWIAAAICLYLLLTGGKNQEIVCAASAEKQAALVFESMRQMIEADPTLRELCGGKNIIPSKNRIAFPDTNSFFVAVTSGGDALHGLSPTCVVMDELHAWKTRKHRDLYTALTTGFGARKKPLTIMISTQTADRTSIAHEVFEYCRRLKNRIENGKVKKSGTIENPSYLAVLYYADEKAEWTDPAVWESVNPAFNDFMNTDDFRQQYDLACQIPSQQTAFKQLRLNMPVASLGKWMDMSSWDACKGDLPDEDELAKHQCWGGLDLAPVNDLSAFSLVWQIEDKFYFRSWAWCNAADILQRSQVEGVPYDVWQKQKWIKGTSGNTTDFKVITKDIIEICNRYRIQMIGADRSHAYDVAQNLMEAGFAVDWFRPGFESMSRPTQRLEKLVMERNLVHEGNPVADYCIGNVVCEMDAAENIRPSNNKKIRREQDKIDVAVSMIIALGMCLGKEKEFVSMYETEGVFVV